ncbi:MAG TPA: hypothetical protein O0X70_01645 [Methanocorpusculum sp.]|nr:hypothetical protein [Methanocorpusculum sp.]
MKKSGILLAACLVVSFCIFCAGCINMPEYDITDPIIGTYKYSQDIPYLNEEGGKLCTLYYVFDMGGEGSQYWITTDGSETKVLKTAWTNAGENLYIVKTILPSGTIYGENLYLTGNVLKPEVSMRSNGAYVKMAGISQD